MNFKPLAIQVLMNNIGGANNHGNAAAALDQLVGGKKGFDLGEIVGKFQASGGSLAGITKSWLGDGDNDPISAIQVKQVIGSGKIVAFARALGIDGDEANHKLTEILPQLIDKSSQRGKLINSGSGKSGFAAFASRFVRKSA